MSFRFQKRVRVAPGIRLNLSKSGVSTSIGRRGASFTAGKRGLHGNVGVPGSGLSYRTRIDTKDKKYGRTSQMTPSYSSQRKEEERQLKIEQREELLALAEDDAKLINEETNRLLVLHKQLFQPVNSLTALVDKTFNFDLTPPSKDTMKSDLLERKKSKLSFVEKIKVLFPKNKKEFLNTVETETQALYKESMSAYEEKQRAFQEEKKLRYDLARKAEFGDTNAMEDWVSLYLEELDFPLETDIDFKVMSSEEVYIDIDLPTIDEVPDEKARVLKSGKLKVEQKTQRDHREHYALLVGGTALYLASFFLAYLPTVNKTTISGYNQILDDSTGHEKDQYIYSLKVDRDTLYHLNMEKVHPIKAFDHFEPRLNATKTYIFKEIEPYKPKAID
ncbi:MULTISPECIES: DUF4236 domain-containing protein [Bacillaceae]|uniref:DUF4236 domain-containing protein n=1 Tax=Evansella alkalicola TaxID=745819 RepID=A0ABS6JZP1_9BACI|nr:MULTISPECIES: DUF4236 domain-containing protein [Bacillaceae]MBU9724067.1 DUF4236 domain-containing protein [Bacillus alkalicola]